VCFSSSCSPHYTSNYSPTISSHTFPHSTHLNAHFPPQFHRNAILSKSRKECPFGDFETLSPSRKECPFGDFETLIALVQNVCSIAWAVPMVEIVVSVALDITPRNRYFSMLTFLPNFRQTIDQSSAAFLYLLLRSSMRFLSHGPQRRPSLVASLPQLPQQAASSPAHHRPTCNSSSTRQIEALADEVKFWFVNLRSMDRSCSGPPVARARTRRSSCPSPGVAVRGLPGRAPRPDAGSPARAPRSSSPAGRKRRRAATTSCSGSGDALAPQLSSFAWRGHGPRRAPCCSCGGGGSPRGVHDCATGASSQRERGSRRVRARGRESSAAAYGIHGTGGVRFLSFPSPCGRRFLVRNRFFN
jgi:hypothetical protein